MDTSSENKDKTFSNSKSQDDNTDKNRSPVLHTGYVFRTRSTGSWSTSLGIGNITSFPHAGSRRKTISESSDASSTEGGALDPPISSLTTDPDPKRINRSSSPFSINTGFGGSTHHEQNLSFGNSSQVVYDIDGKFPYSYYESKPTLYDIDGIHRYKYYGAYKPTPYTDCAPHHEKRRLDEGMVMCLTAKDMKGQKGWTQNLTKNND